MTEDFLTLQPLKCCILFFHSYVLFLEGGMSFFKPEISHDFSPSMGFFSFVWNSSGLQYAVFVKAICMFLKVPSHKRELVSSTDLNEIKL